MHLSVVGAGEAEEEVLDLAVRVGREVARQGCILVCGGLGGVMAAACRGAREVGGRTVAIVPGSEASSANLWAEVVVPTGIGHARNVIVVQSGDAVIALPGLWGTLSEVALALKIGKPVAAVRAWRDIPGVLHEEEPERAVIAAVARATGKR